MELTKLITQVKLSYFPKKEEIEQKALELSESIIEKAKHNPLEVYSQIKRLKEFVDTLESKFKEDIPDEGFEAFGLTVKKVNKRDKPIFEDDEIYRNLKKDLKDREELLKTALKQSNPIYDPYGNEIPKVSTKPQKDYFTVSF